MAELVDVLAYYECACGFAFVDQYPRNATPELQAACPACETPGVNE
ncbi:hypothetical protein DWB77_02086 [Streptomyces hundungensis]|uniref:Uncharacterized protein n=1 Tax=Streptomyces hundungensis TaxID=1077946 RepID=A0A387HH30_9ACTN|nr:hypothetical protein DWB77_02086 [Streptomyces hundungensis]